MKPTSVAKRRVIHGSLWKQEAKQNGCTVSLVSNNAPWAKTVLQELLMNNANYHVALFESSCVVMARSLACVGPKIVQNSDYQFQSGWYEREDTHQPANHKTAVWEGSQLSKRLSPKCKQDTCAVPSSTRRSPEGRAWEEIALTRLSVVEILDITRGVPMLARFRVFGEYLLFIQAEPQSSLFFRANQSAYTFQVLSKGNKWSLNPHLDDLCVRLKIRIQIGVSLSIVA